MTAPTRRGTEGASAERRLVTVLFADIVDSTALADRMDPEDWSEAIRRVVALMSAPIERYGGTVARVMGDGLFAVFGAPVVHEDDALRAVRAGLEMVDAVAEAGPAFAREVGAALHIRVGINTGVAIVEGLGTGSREIDALGDTVNVAARIEAAARPGTVLVTAETWRHAAPVFQGRPLGGIALKGKAEPVEAWEVLAPSDLPGSTRGVAGLASPMVGRDEQLQALVSLVHATRAGRGRAALVMGEPGVGKSRLLAEVQSHAADSEVASPDRARWIEARCVSYGENVPYGLLGDLVIACLGLARAADRTELRSGLAHAVESIFGEDATATYEALAHVLSLPLDDDAERRLAPLSPEALRERYLSATEALMRRLCSARPAVVVVEDAHWADSSSVEVVRRLLPLAHEVPVLLVLSMRPERRSPGWRLVEAAREAFGDALTEIALGALDPTDSRVLVGHLLEIETLPERIRSFILDRAEGNPFFVEEIIRMLIERGWVVRRGDRWIGSGSVSSAEFPETLRGLLLARIDQLAEDARRMLRVASVIGRDVPLRLLEDVTGDPGGTARALGLAEAAGLVRFAAADPEPVYRFRHVLVQEAAYDSLLKADRRRLHRDVGLALEERHPDRLDELAPILGLHFERAGDVEKGVAYLHTAGRQAMRRFAVREARDLLDRAAALLDAAPETPTDFERRRLEIDLDRAAAGVTFVPFDDDIALIVRSVERAERLGDERLLGLALAREAVLRHIKGGPEERERILETVERATEIGRRLGAPEIYAHPMAIKGELLWRDNDRRAAIPILEEAVRLLEPQSVADAAYYTGHMAINHAELGQFEQADRFAAHAKELAERSGDPNALLDVDIFEGMIRALEGRPAEAAELARRGAERAALAGNTLCEVVGSWLVGEQELAMGRVMPAIQWLEKARGLAQYCTAADVERLSGVSLQVARALAGEGVQALHGLDGPLQDARESGDAFSEGRILLRRGAANVQLPGGDLEQARADLERAIRIFGTLEALPYLAQAKRAHAMLAQQVSG